MPTAPEREPYVPMPNCTLSVSPWTIVICSMGMPSRCEVSWANVVSWPWPWLCEPVSTSTEPLVVRKLQRLVEAGSVVTRVVGHDDGGGVREGLDEVLAAKLGRVLAGL